MAEPSTPRSRATAPDSAALRGVILVVVAVCIGIFLLAKGDDDVSSATVPGHASSTTVAGGKATTTTVATAATQLPPAQLPVLVVNGAGSKDGKLASKTKTTLAGLGYTSVKPADSKPKDAYGQTQVWYLTGFEADATAVAKALGLPVARVQVLPADPKAGNLADAKVVVALGPDAPGIAGGAVETTIAPQTTAAPATTAKK